NFITTPLDMRAKGMSMMRMPLTCWAWFITAILGLLAFGVLAAGGILLLMDRNLGTSFFVPGGLNFTGQTSFPPGGFSPSTDLVKHNGGSPLLWQHLFWFFGHPEVYIAIVPGMGVASQLLSTFSRKPIFGYRAMVYALLAIGILGFVVWGHHMFMSGMSPYSAFAFSVMTMAIGVLSAIKTFNWLGTIYHGRVRFQTSMLDVSVGRCQCFSSLVGPYGMFMPMHYLSMAGQTRRYSQFTEVAYQTKLIPVQKFMTYAAFITIAGQLIFLFNLFWSMAKGRK